MRRACLAAAAAIALSLAGAAYAHSTVTKTSIAENAQLAQAPATFTASFEHDAGVSSVKLTGVGGETVPLDFTAPKAMAKSFTVPLPRLAAGAYTLSWKALSKDGHAMSSAVHFTITG